MEVPFLKSDTNKGKEYAREWMELYNSLRGQRKWWKELVTIKAKMNDRDKWSRSLL